MPFSTDHLWADEAPSSGSASVTLAWPQEIIAADPASGDRCTVRIAPVVTLEPSPSVSLFHQVALGDRIALHELCWTLDFDTEDEAHRAADWIERHPSDSAAACRIGTRAAFENLDCWMRVGLVQEQLKAEEKERERRRLQEEADRRSASIESFLVDAGGQFGLDLRRFGAKTGFWRIMFREKWERERFRDWFRCQRHRFEEFATFLDDHDALVLERQLLAEMLDTERRIKAAGLGAGGRRPLRFWRGD